MLTHRGFSAWISVDGEALPEYLVAVDTKAHQVSCWIPSEEGQSFTIFWRDHGGKVDTCAFITLDGFLVPGRFLFGDGVAWREGVRISPTSERPFIFQRIEEADDQPSIEAAAKDAGIVALRIKRIDRVTSVPANAIIDPPQPVLGKRKAGEICVGFGEEKKTYEQYPMTWAVKPHDNDVPGATTPSTYVSFVFRYRSREFLESQGIITKPESLVSTPKTGSTPKRTPSSRVVSLPSISSSKVVQSPNKKQKSSIYPLRMEPHESHSSSNARRAVSAKTIRPRSNRVPGEGFIQFDEKRENPCVDDPGQSSTKTPESEQGSKE